jgi:hypothetical protein
MKRLHRTKNNQTINNKDLYKLKKRYYRPKELT